MMMDAIAQLAWNASTIALLPPNPILGMTIFKQEHPLKGKKIQGVQGAGGGPPYWPNPEISIRWLPLSYRSIAKTGHRDRDGNTQNQDSKVTIFKISLGNIHNILTLQVECVDVSAAQNSCK